MKSLEDLRNFFFTINTWYLLRYNPHVPTFFFITLFVEISAEIYSLGILPLLHLYYYIYHEVNFLFYDSFFCFVSSIRIHSWFVTVNCSLFFDIKL